DPAERDAIDESGVGWVTVASIRARGAASALEAPLQRMKAQRVHVHIDLDVHDPALAPANEFAPPDGLTPAEVQNSMRAIAAGRPPPLVPCRRPALPAPRAPPCATAGSSRCGRRRRPSPGPRRLP